MIELGGAAFSHGQWKWDVGCKFFQELREAVGVAENFPACALRILGGSF